MYKEDGGVNMISIAIIEDSMNEYQNLVNLLLEYEKKQNLTSKFQITHFETSERFLNSQLNLFDLVFMDVKLPNQNGINAALKFRDSQKYTPIIFVTNMTQYAIQGYKVNALDYIIKPATMDTLVLPLEKALKFILDNKDELFIIKNSSGYTKIWIKDIYYIEVADHKLTYHTKLGDLFGYGSLSDLEIKLKNHNFLRSNSCYLVNPKHIIKIDKQFTTMTNGDSLKISKPRKKKFMESITEWLGQGNFI